MDEQIATVLHTLQQNDALKNTVVVITAQRAITFDNSDNPGNRATLQVPLVVHWPNTPAQSIDRLTDQQDVMTTLMQRLLHAPIRLTIHRVKICLPRSHNWVASSEDGKLVVTTPTVTLVLSNNGNYSAYDAGVKS